LKPVSQVLLTVLMSNEPSKSCGALNHNYPKGSGYRPPTCPLPPHRAFSQ